MLRNINPGALLSGAVGCLCALTIMSGLSDRTARADGEDAKPVPRIAVCDIWALSQELARSDRFEDRFADEKEAREELMEMYEELEEMREKMEDMNPDDPDYERAYREYWELSTTYREKHAEQSNFDTFAKVLKEAREMVIESAEGVAHERGYTIVVTTYDRDNVPEEVKSEDQTSEQGGAYFRVWSEHLAQPIVVLPEGDDITEEVRDDLNL